MSALVLPSFLRMFHPILQFSKSWKELGYCASKISLPESFISQTVVIFCSEVGQWSPQARCQSLSDSRSRFVRGEDRDKEASLCSGFAGGGTAHSSYWEHVTQEVKIQLRPMPACLLSQHFRGGGWSIRSWKSAWAMQQVSGLQELPQTTPKQLNWEGIRTSTA